MTILSPLFLVILILAVVLVVMVLATRRGQSVGDLLKKQGVAWAVTGLMILAALGIGQAKARAGTHTPEPEPTPAPVVTSDVSGSHWSCVYDEADVLSAGTKQTIDQRNQRLWEEKGVIIAVVTCNYGRSDLYDYALDYADGIGLNQDDFIVVLDISGDNYWLVQGSGLYSAGLFSDEDCGSYAYEYMEEAFASRAYDKAVLSLTEALEKWYDTNYR